MKRIRIRLVCKERTNSNEGIGRRFSIDSRSKFTNKKQNIVAAAVSTSTSPESSIDDVCFKTDLTRLLGKHFR